MTTFKPFVNLFLLLLTLTFFHILRKNPGYEVPAEAIKATNNSILKFDYRTQRISDLRMSLKLADQHLSWFLTLSPSTDWKTMSLPLNEKIKINSGDMTAKSLHLTTFYKAATVDEPESVLDLDNFRIESRSLSKQQEEALNQKMEDQSQLVSTLDQAIKIKGLNFDWSMGSDGKKIYRVSYDLVNVSDREVQIPVNNDYSRPMKLLGSIQRWIVPMDAGAKTTDFGRAAITAKGIAAGGTIVPIENASLEAGESVEQSSRLADLKPGKYKFIVELKSIKTDKVIDQAETEFEVK